MKLKLMNPVVHGSQRGSRNCTTEFREAVAAEASDPNRPITEVDRAHSLNAMSNAFTTRSASGLVENDPPTTRRVNRSNTTAV